MAIKKRRFFKKKQKKRKFNKFFSYKSVKRVKRKFIYKNFAKSNSYNTRFTCSDFSYVNFDKAKMKYCGFNGAYFNETEFKNSNLRGSRFKSATFKNVVFFNTVLDKVVFTGAKFDNVIFVCSNPKKAHGISSDMKANMIVYDSMPPIELSPNLAKAIKNALGNKHIYDSEVLVLNNKARTPNSVNINKLLDQFSEDELIEGLNLAKVSIKKDFYTLSYLTAFIRKALHAQETKNSVLVSSEAQIL